MIPITLMGAGAWGTALAVALARRTGSQVCLWARDPAVVAVMRETRLNARYLPDIELPPALEITDHFSHALRRSRDGLTIIASSVAGLRPLCERLSEAPPSSVLWLCKGLEQETDLLPHQVVRQVLPGVACGVLSGPSFALEVARGLPTALTCATADDALMRRAVAAMHGGALRVYASHDLAGVEVGGAIKNILAIATGLCDGMDLGMNARAALITRGLAEMTRFGMANGARAETFMGLAGVGDLLLTATGDLSRNRRVGLMLARGQALDEVVAELGHVAEGVRCAASVLRRGQSLGVDLPIVSAVNAVLFSGLSPREAVDALLARDPRHEAG